MLIIDTNIILRYLLNDHPELSERARSIISDNQVLIVTQVVAEVIYVLGGVYKSTRQEISESLNLIFSNENVTVENHDIVVNAVNEYKYSTLDFVDILLYSYSKVTGKEVATFDKKLNVLLKN